MSSLQTAGSFSFAGSGSVSGYLSTGTWNRVTGYLENATANDTLAMVYVDAYRINGVEATVRVDDGIALFCSAQGTNGLTGMRAGIEYVGSETKIYMTVFPNNSTPSTSRSSHYVEAPMPSIMARGDQVTLRLMPSLAGWMLSIKVGSSYKNILSIPYLSFSAGEITLTSLKTATSTKCGVIGTKTGVRIYNVIMYSIGSRFAPYGSSKTMYSHTYSGSGAHNPTTGASVMPDDSYTVTNAAISGQNEISGRLQVTNNSPVFQVLSISSNGPDLFDQPVQIIKLGDYQSGQLAIKLSLAGTGKNIYINSDIASAGTFKAITVETNGP
jgi:hypothetical protein